ncbi:hypothetical protein [Rhizobium alvei]|uniref:Uncharacterized protein n=1 Tax=Rhizobium alvei TaxID=1132659 RepID=A0ABT8YTA9_9HYPH|nr:hypothetical protein [Rhizobium alvei]MDO6966971.1 hypothetical protein [Rhizobium alvei]
MLDNVRAIDMEVASIPMPNVELTIEVVTPRAFGLRLSLMRAALWVAGFVAPSNIAVNTDIKVI